MNLILLTPKHNPHYLRRYMRFIENVSIRSIPDDYNTERHHICPSSLFPEYKNLKEHPWNSIHLTSREHYIAHLILAKAYGGPMIYALRMMGVGRSSEHHTSGNRWYDWAKLQSSELSRQDNTGRVHVNRDGVIKKVLASELDDFTTSGWCLGTGVQSIVGCTRVEMQGARKFVHSNQVQTYIQQGWSLGWSTGAANQDKVAVNKDGRVRYVEKSEVQATLDKGWSLGSNGKTNTGKVRMSRLDDTRMVDSEDIQTFLEDGWELGYCKLKGSIAINDGDRSKVVPRDELDHYLQDGWIQGRLCKPTKGKVGVYRGDVNKKILKDELQMYLDAGWKKGSSSKGRTLINKDGQIKMVAKDEAYLYIQEGWKKGRPFSPTKGRKKIKTETGYKFE